MELYITLVHSPIFNKAKKIVTTSVTNFDLHDISRNGATYNVKKYFVMTPSEAQLNMVRYIKEYWSTGYGATYNPDRKQAIEILEPIASIEEARLTIKNLSGRDPLLVATSAKRYEKSVSYSFVKEKLAEQQPILLAFGTGHGLADEFMDAADYILDPIDGCGNYNHLPVRSAVAIILDRLVGR